MKGLCTFKAEFVKAFPSTFYAFTRFCLDNNLPLPELKGIMSTGEPLHDYQKSLFERTYHGLAFDMYGSRETGNTACECSLPTKDVILPWKLR